MMMLGLNGHILSKHNVKNVLAKIWNCLKNLNLTIKKEKKLKLNNASNNFSTYIYKFFDLELFKKMIKGVGHGKFLY